MQSLNKADHMFQLFGYKGEREWKHLTRGVAACLAMMKLIDQGPFRDFWQKVKRGVRTGRGEYVIEEIEGKQMALPIPLEVEALLQSYKLPE